MERLSDNISYDADKEIIAIRSKNAMVVSAGPQPAVQPYDTVEKKSGSGHGYKPWGSSDTFTKDIITKIRQHPFLGTVLEYKANTMASGELQYGIEEISETGEKTFKQVFNTEIESFLESNNIDGFRQEILRDLFTWNNAFAGYTRGLSNFNKIVELFAFDATECRLDWQNTVSGKKEKLFIDANFVNGSVPKPQKDVRLVDPYFWNFDEYRKLTDKQFAQFLYFHTSSEKYYQRAAWHSFFDSKWHDVAIKIAQFKSALMDNQMAIRWVVDIPIQWWEWKYPGWSTNKYDAAAKKAIIIKEGDYINEVLSGVEKAGKTLVTTFFTDKMGKNSTKWTITPVDNKLMSGVYVEDSQEASLMALFAMAVHGSVIGNTPGKSQTSSGSGSDIRVASNMFVVNNKVYDNKQLEPLRFVSSFNDWKVNGKRVLWRIKHDMLTTSDNVTPAQRP